MGIIATHDLELGSLEGQYPENITNYCFEVLIKDEKFTYDYNIEINNELTPDTWKKKII